MPYGLITNKLNECAGMLGAQGVVSYLIDENNYYILQTDQITECICIGILIYSNEQKLKQISLLHSLSEHRFPDNQHEASSRLRKYLTKTFQNRESLLKNSLTYERVNGLYFACSLVQMLSALGNQDHIIIKLQLGSNNSEQSTIKSGLKGLRKWLNTYQELTNLNFTFDIKIHDKHSCYFAIDSQNNTCISSIEYKQYVLLKKFENKIQSNTFKAKFYHETAIVNIENQNYKIPESVFNIYQKLKHNTQNNSFQEKTVKKVKSLVEKESASLFHVPKIFHKQNNEPLIKSSRLQVNLTRS